MKNNINFHDDYYYYNIVRKNIRKYNPNPERFHNQASDINYTTKTAKFLYFGGFLCAKNQDCLTFLVRQPLFLRKIDHGGPRSTLCITKSSPKANIQNNVF